MVSVALTLGAFLASACVSSTAGRFVHEPDPGAIATLSARELEVIEKLLRHEYKDAITKGKPLIIRETPRIEMLVDDAPIAKQEEKLLNSVLDSVPRSAIRDFLRVNARPGKFGDQLQSRLPAVLLSQADQTQIFADGWDRFYRIFPGSPGFITISRVGFSADGQIALLYHGAQREWLVGGGRLRAFKRSGIDWVEESIGGPVWISQRSTPAGYLAVNRAVMEENRVDYTPAHSEGR